MVLPPAILGIMSLSARDLVLRMFTEPLGHVMLTTGLTLQFVGWLLLRRIVDIKV
jgi:Flp pilus assembly protein TadB